MREMVFGQDADFTDEAILARYNADLANDLGNLVSRATTMIHRYCGGVVPGAGRRAAGATRRKRDAAAGARRPRRPRQGGVESFQFSQALREIWDVIGATNRYIVTREPWTLAKDAARRAELDTALYVAADTVRVVAELLRPFMPGDRRTHARDGGRRRRRRSRGWRSGAARSRRAAASAPTQRRCFHASNTPWRS